MTKPTAYFIETARGASVDKEALADGTKDAVIVGAGLNTYAVERLPMSSQLRRLQPERVILMPYSLPHSRQEQEANLCMVVHNVLGLAAGRVPVQVVNQDAIPAYE